MIKTTKILIAILIIAYLARLVPSLILHYPVQNDASEYNDIGWQLASHLSYSRDGATPTILRPPGYPVMLAVVYAFAGHNTAAVVYFQVMLGLLAVYLTYLLALAVFKKTNLALLAAALAAISPLFIYYELFLYSENLAIVAFLAFAYWLFLAQDRGSWRYFALSGLAFTVLVLTKPIFVPVIIFLLLFLYINRAKFNFKVALLASMLPLVILGGAWTVRNYLAFHQFLPLGIGLGRVLYVGNNPNFNNDWPKEEEINRAVPELANTDEINYDKILKAKAIEEIKASPFTFVKFSAQRVIKYLANARPIARSEIFSRGVKSGMLLLVFPLVFAVYFYYKITISILFIAGIILLVKNYSKEKNSYALFLASLALYALASHSVLYIDERYHLITFPVHIILASYTLYFFGTKLSADERHN